MSDEKTCDELKAELAQCREENKLKSEFLSMVTHQLRTPLSGIKWTFKMLLDGDLGSFSDEQRQIIEKGAESNERMIDLLKEIIVANQNQSWDFQYEMQKIDIEKLAERLITEHLENARVHEVSLVFKHHDSGELPMITADPDKIAIVLQNLLENAIKYTPADGTVTVNITSSEDNVTICIADTGIGIPEKSQEHLFEKFWRADNAKELKKEGTGLGLFTAKKITQRHGGTITCESEAGKGSVFCVQLPIEQANN